MSTTINNNNNNDYNNNQDRQPCREQTVFELNSSAVFQLQQGNYDLAISTLEEALQSLRRMGAELLRRRRRHYHHHHHHHRDDEQYRDGPGRQQIIMNDDDIVAEDFPSFYQQGMRGYGSNNAAEGEAGGLQEITMLPASIDVNERPCDRMRRNNNYDRNARRGDRKHYNGNVFDLFEMAFCTLYLNHKGARGYRFMCGMIHYTLALAHHHRVFAVSDNHDDQGDTVLVHRHHRHHHQEGADSHTNSYHLDRALAYYSAALHAVHGCFNYFSVQREDLALLSMAICNNMGHIYAYLCRGDDARRCHENLCLVPWQWNFLQRQRDIGFFLNTMCQPPSAIFTKAPAA